MSTLNNTIGSNLRQFRERFGLSQEDLAKFLKISHVAVSHYETGKRSVPSEVINKAAGLFGVDGYDFYEENVAQQKNNMAFAFRASELTEHDLEQIAEFRTVVRNYLNMINASKRETESQS
ncbi:MAG: helix-turn-helix domain-containing protein [Dyadobacter fermentans]